MVIDSHSMPELEYWRRLDWKRYGMIIRLIDTSHREELSLCVLNLSYSFVN
jgi:hypothetical protein